MKKKNRGLDVLVKFIEEIFFGEIQSSERGSKDILPDYVDMSKAIPIKRSKQRSSTRSKQAKKSVKRVDKILKNTKKNKKQQEEEEPETQYKGRD